MSPDRSPLSFAVVIPTFNRRDLVLAAIHSALAQELPPDEVLVVDGESADGTVEAVRATFGDRVRLFAQPNRGPSAARNRAIAEATSDVVAFLDSDNRWRSHHVLTLAELFDRHPQAVAAGTSRDYLQGSETAHDAVFGDVAVPLLLERRGIGFLSSVAVRRGDLIASGAFPEARWFGEDIEMYIQLALRGPFALISARTLDRGLSHDSLENQGKRSGGYVHFREDTAASAIRTIDALGHIDADELRAAARGRDAVGRALRGIAERMSPADLRPCLLDAFRRAPERCDRARLERDFAVVVPGWDDDVTRRDEATVLLARAWPRGFKRVGAEVRLAGLAAAARLGDHRAIRYLAIRAITPAGFRPAWRRLRRLFDRDA